MPRKEFIVEPRNDSVIIIRFPKGKQKSGEIHLPDSVETPFDIGEIVAVGPGLIDAAPMKDLRPGQQVLVMPVGQSMRTGQPAALDIPMRYKGKSCEIVPSYQIFGIIHEATPKLVGSSEVVGVIKG